MTHIWAAFLELDAARPQSGFGLSPITYEAISAHQSLLKGDLEPWEIRAIRAVDDAVLFERAQEDKRK